MTANDRNRDALALFEDRREQVGRLDRLTPGAARLVERQLEHQFGGGRDTQLTAGERRQDLQVFFQPLQDFVRVQLQVAHHL
jgi:hypothetical protein